MTRSHTKLICLCILNSVMSPLPSTLQRNFHDRLEYNEDWKCMLSNTRFSCQKVLLDCSKSYESSILDSRDLEDFMYRFDSSVYKILHFLLAALYILNFCSSLRFIIISSVHGAFSFFINLHAIYIARLYKSIYHFSYAVLCKHKAPDLKKLC